MCIVLTSASYSTVSGSGSLKKLWTSGYNTDYDISSVHYTSNTVIAVYHNRANDRLYLGKLSYCSGSKINDDLSIMEQNILPKSVQAYENRLFYVTHEENSHDFNLVCTDLNLNKLWNYNYKDESDFEWTWLDLKDDILIVHTNSGVLVFELKTGKKLAKLDTSFLVDSINNNCVLTKSDKLALIDPYTEKPVWTYDFPTSGINCFGIHKGFVLLATKPTDDDQSTKAICLDANTGKEVFSIEYNLTIFWLGISGDLLGIVYKIDECNYVLDAFSLNGWSYVWTRKKLCDLPYFTSNTIFSVLQPCQGCINLYKIKPIDGTKDENFHISFSDFPVPIFYRNIFFQANRIIVAYGSIACYIDESF